MHEWRSCLLSFLPAKLVGRPRLHWRRPSFNTTWAVVHIPFPVGITDCFEAAWSEEGVTLRRLRLDRESLEGGGVLVTCPLVQGRSPPCTGIWSLAVNLFLVASGPLNLGFYENTWGGRVSNASFASQKPFFLICKVKS